MAPETIQIIIAVVGLLGSGGVIGLIIYLLSRKSSQSKTSAETDKIEAEIRSTEIEIYSRMQKTIDALTARMDVLYKSRAEDRARIDQLESELNVLKREIRELKSERIETDKEVARLHKALAYYRAVIVKLIEQLQASGIVPIWMPPNSSKDEPQNGAAKK